jgi:hypothetical protein
MEIGQYPISFYFNNGKTKFKATAILDGGFVYHSFRSQLGDMQIYKHNQSDFEEALKNNTSGSLNAAVGIGCLGSNTSGGNNSAIGVNASSGNFSSSVILGREATATASNQFVAGSVAHPAGAVTTEANTSTKVWNVKINGVDYKILLA